MLFNSPQFIFAFLPIALMGFFALGHFEQRRAAILWLGVMSLIFYGFDNPLLQIPLILLSIGFNFTVGRSLALGRRRGLLIVGVVSNLLLLGFFKYTNLLLETLSAVTLLPMPHANIPLPIGISFYTFTQIAFLVDVYRGEAREYKLSNYGLFVTFFPHLIAGPILHHRDTVPQFDRPEILKPQHDCIALGISWFAIGLFKKVILADSIAPFADAVFGAARKDEAIGLADAWIGTLSYTLQIYFDFSGYSDMAIGLALLFGITFPLNFNSPYKAASIVDFWRCWHMTLSRFLRDYLYIPLGGNRYGAMRRYLNLMITMVLGGFWHGASWNFAIWGAIHGGGLAINHLWTRAGFAMPSSVGRVLTLALVIFAWVPFRADTLDASVRMWASMVGAGELSSIADIVTATCWITGLSAIALFAPNTQQIMSGDVQLWKPRPAWAILLGCVFGVAVAGTFGRESVFLYFRF